MRIQIIVMLMLLLIVSQSAQANQCGSRNLGALPNMPTRFCLGERVTRYDYCGNTAGILVGQADHPLFCETAWGPNPDTVQVCANERFMQEATRGPTTRDRAMYSRNKGWLWSPNASSVCVGETFTQTSNCGFTREKAGTKACACVPKWTPHRSTVCSGEAFTQTSSCGGERSEVGTKACETGPEIPDINKKHNKTIWMTTPQGDEGYFQFNGQERNLMIIYNDNQDNIVRRYRSPAGHPYKVWIDDNQTGGWPLNLVTRNYFDMWISYIDEKKPGGQKYHPNKHWCELVENIWSPWTTDPIPTACGVHTYQSRRTCSQQGAAKPCPFACPNGTTNQTQVQNHTIDNGPCGGGPGEPEPPAPEWDYVGTISVDTNTLQNGETLNRSCAKFSSNFFGPDRYNKWRRYNTNNTQYPYACSASEVGDIDYCYENSTGEQGGPGGIDRADRINFECR